MFCSNRQLYAVLADDHNKKILFYGSTLQKSICGDPPCGTVVSRRRLLRLQFALYSGGNYELSLLRRLALDRRLPAGSGRSSSGCATSWASPRSPTTAMGLLEATR